MPSSWPRWADRGAANNNDAASPSSGDRNDIGDRHVWCERMDHRAVLLDGQAHRPLCLGLVYTFAGEMVIEVNGGVSAGLLLSPQSACFDAKLTQLDPHFLEDDDHIGPTAGGRCE